MVKVSRSHETYILDLSTFLLILVWVYAAVSKVAAFSLFKQQMRMQVFPSFIQTGLIYLLPPSELIVAGLLIFTFSRLAGYIASFLLFLTFTIYVGLAAFHLLPQRPCACGGILTHVGWTGHFYFNLFFSALIFMNIILIYRKGNR